eukprot:scaffold9191_cov114-Isochrysis_galbana.AAC.4
MYAMQWLPSDLCADYQLRQQWIDNNMSYLDGRALAVLQSEDSDFRRDSWSVYHNLYMCRLGVCPHQWLWDLDLDVYGLSTPTAIIHSCPMCFNPGLPNPNIFPARSIAEASAQFQNRDPTIEREGPVTPLYGYVVPLAAGRTHRILLLTNP